MAVNEVLLLSTQAGLPMTERERLVLARSSAAFHSQTRRGRGSLWGAEGAMGNLAVDVMWRPSIGIDR
jgi:hypothetical protein